ncbi:MAG: M23 family metallopeptidase [Deltaproteobacteria bacterium]|nr:M23 family metallopeptidase [Deltaproteobacteria bacterium]
MPGPRARLVLLGALVAVNAAVVAYHGDPRGRVAVAPVNAAPALLSDALPTEQIDPLLGLRVPGPIKRVDLLKLRSGQTVAAALSEVGAADDEVNEALSSMRSLIQFRRLKPGDVLKARFDADDKLVSLDVHANLRERIRADQGEQGWAARPLEVRIDSQQAHVSGEIKSSLWETLVGQGERPSLVLALVDVFAWDIDFYSEIYPGDTFRVLVEKEYIDSKLYDYGAILAAEFVTAGIVHRAFRFEGSEGRVGYYDEEGRSLRKMLLKSPLQYGNVTSSFGKRLHPVLGYTRAHNGIDYGVPTGTPVWSVGDGRVMRAGWFGAYGRLVEVRHANGWMSQYAHLSKLSVKPGEWVTQKQVIGQVGSSGLATGPHLHYGLLRSGGFVNPATQSFERGKSLAGTELGRFKEALAGVRDALEQVRVAVAVPGQGDG